MRSRERRPRFCPHAASSSGAAALVVTPLRSVPSHARPRASGAPNAAPSHARPSAAPSTLAHAASHPPPRAAAAPAASRATSTAPPAASRVASPSARTALAHAAPSATPSAAPRPPVARALRSSIASPAATPPAPATAPSPTHASPSHAARAAPSAACPSTSHTARSLADVRTTSSPSEARGKAAMISALCSGEATTSTAPVAMAAAGVHTRANPLPCSANGCPQHICSRLAPTPPDATPATSATGEPHIAANGISTLDAATKHVVARRIAFAGNARDRDATTATANPATAPSSKNAQLMPPVPATAGNVRQNTSHARQKPNPITVIAPSNRAVRRVRRHCSHFQTVSNSCIETPSRANASQFDRTDGLFHGIDDATARAPSPFPAPARTLSFRQVR